MESNTFHTFLEEKQIAVPPLLCWETYLLISERQTQGLELVVEMAYFE